MDDESLTPAPRLRRNPFALRSQRMLQIALGLFWLLDAGLQFQPYMFRQSFVTTFILPNASGQPAFIASFITNIGHFITPDVAVWNTFFALIQLFIGLGLLFRRTTRPALAVSFAWVLGVWVLGEGLGLILTGTATALTGAPGSVLMYGLIGLMAWPRPSRNRVDWSDDENGGLVGVASSSAAHGIGRAITPLAVWSGYWSLAAVLFVLPDNRTQTSVSSAIVGMASGQPGWYAHFLTSFGNFFDHSGAESAWVLAVISLIIGFGPLVARRPGWFLLAGSVASLVLWVTGQGLLGGVLTGSGTDPNTGPLVILLAAAMVPLAVATRASWRSPLVLVLRRSPVLPALGVAAVAAAMALSATYPVAAQESSSLAMSGMHMSNSSSGSTGSTGGATSTCNAHENGLKISGLDLSNTPYMIMSGHLGMDMNGADASAAAGFNTTKVNWHYTGPALPGALAQELLADGSNSPNRIHMAVSGCATTLTSTQQIDATQFVQATSQAAARFANPFEAAAGGYVAASPTNYPIVYYVNPAIVAANAAAKRTLSPQHIDGLVFAKTPSGQEILAGAMYILPATVNSVPMPYGALVQWHERTDVCGPAAGPGPALFDISGFSPCSAGATLGATPYVSVVWQVPVAGGPLAIQPPDIQIVEAAIMESLGT